MLLHINNGYTLPLFWAVTIAFNGNGWHYAHGYNLITVLPSLNTLWLDYQWISCNLGLPWQVATYKHTNTGFSIPTSKQSMGMAQWYGTDRNILSRILCLLCGFVLFCCHIWDKPFSSPPCSSPHSLECLAVHSVLLSLRAFLFPFSFSLSHKHTQKCTHTYTSVCRSLSLFH